MKKWRPATARGARLFAGARSGAHGLVFGEGERRRKSDAAAFARELTLAVGVGALVATQVRELRVRLGADLALVRLDAAVDVHVLLEAARRGERLAARGARERAVLGLTAARVGRVLLSVGEA